ncbi:MAG: M64 family metallopeptidase, partial [Prevotellaceae bacterium]|nr:M64 family metallopeptidase [Prevotellaceae bacterium]
LKELNLCSNRLSGTFPKSMTNMTSLVSIDLRDNRFSGPVPEEILSWKIWKGAWGCFVAGNDFTEEDVMSYHIPAPEFQVTDINGNIWDNSIYSKNKYTALFVWRDAGWMSEYVNAWSSLLLPVYTAYHDKGLEIISWSPDDKSTVQQYAGNWPWITLHSPEYPEEGETRNNVSGLDGFSGWLYPGDFIPSVTIVDSTGIVVKSSDFDGYLEPTVDFLKQRFEGTVHDWYESTDYSADGTVMELQKAKKGNGIDIVLMGDAYSDRLIADGTYDATMRKVMDVFFTQEPYKTFRDYFNVYDVRAVSKNEVYETGASTALSTGFGEGTLVYGNNNRCINYAFK